MTPEEYFQREWVRSVFALAVERLRERCESEGKQVQFAIFEAYDLDDDRGVSYRELAARFDIPETQVTNYLAAMRRRFREIVLEALREVTATDQEFRAEARALLGSVAMRFLSDDAVARLREITEHAGSQRHALRAGARAGPRRDGRRLRGARPRAGAHGGHEGGATSGWRAEARIIAALEHPGIVPVHDAGALPDGRLYYTMKLVRGVASRRVGAAGSRHHGTPPPLRADLRAGGVRARERRRASRPQTGERDGRRVRRGAGDGLGHRRTSARRATWRRNRRAARAPTRARTSTRSARCWRFCCAASASRVRCAAIDRARDGRGSGARVTPNAQALADDVLRYLDSEPVSAYRENVLERAGRWLTRHRALLTLMAAYLVMRVIVFFWMRL